MRGKGVEMPGHPLMKRVPDEASTQAVLCKLIRIKLEREVNTMEQMDQQDPMFEEDNDVSEGKTWIQENLRIIVSVFIVAAIALGIYSYSQRSQTVSDDGGLLESTGTAEEQSADENAVEEGAESEAMPNKVVITPELSRETETSFVEQAERGNGTTHLARRALAHYLEKNTDSSLTAEHKVYIEDYLRKNVSFRGAVTTNTSIEFQKALIQQAIEKSKTLNDRQLNNLKKYSARVSAYR